MVFQWQLDEISALLFLQGFTDNRFAADTWLPHLKKELEYFPLRDSEIRLLRILPRSAYDDIQLTLDHFQCDFSYRSTQAYRALSYCWGDISDLVAIIVNDCKLSIPRSLEATIRELQRRGYDYLWIDAICINQGDNDERGHQILKMRDIYYNAFETIIWLGEENEHTKEAISIFDCLATQNPEVLFQMRMTQLLRTRPKDLKNLSGWISVAALLALPYWKRTWIIQEMTMSRHTVLLWGSHTIAIRNIEMALDTLCLHSPTFWFYFTGTDHIRGIFRITLAIKDRREDESEVPTAEDLLTVLEQSCLSKASEPRDKVFGVLGLAYDGSNTIPEPNYREPMDSILRKITITELTSVCHGQTVDIICLDHSRRPKRAGLPSWIVDWAALWTCGDGNTWSSRLLRYLSAPSRTIYKACGGSHASVQISSNELVLTCRGYTFDVVSGLSQFQGRFHSGGGWEAPVERHRNAPTSEHELSIFHNVYGSEPELSEAIWLSAVHHPSELDACGNATPFARNLQRLFSADARKPWWVPESWMEVIKDSGEFELYGRKLKDWSTVSLKYPNTIQTVHVHNLQTTDQTENDFWNAIEIGRFGRRMMETSKGYIGTAHSQSQVGDSIVLLQGASVPIILRPYEGAYKVIGEAYVHGIMEGEFWEAQDKAKMQEINLK
ncbi:hypothetical protein VTL71DRAFT_6842 [Oculimacula yallundae]|uniref:Heterokaryon incompatibility domain-containing protein n=1 Tax=Oculimacula yallundae TaxID=86028 RepID=A0ABR4BUZ5_9HELO